MSSEKLDDLPLNEDKIDDGLENEKQLILEAVGKIKCNINHWCHNFKRKNAIVSKICRDIANTLFESDKKNRETCEQVWKYYTKCIAYAPCNSKELSLGYAGRSSFLFYLRKYEDCKNDCYSGIKSLGSSDFLRVQFKIRIIDCLLILKDNNSKTECENALNFIDKLCMETKFKETFKKKIKSRMEMASKLLIIEENAVLRNSREKYYNFIKNEEAPCASKSINIEADKYGNRYIRAVNDIEPGEILVIEKSYLSHNLNSTLYTNCSHCRAVAYSLIPCNSCVFNVYCSEKCRFEDMMKYHQWECNVLPYVWYIQDEYQLIILAVRMMLISLHKAGSINKLKEILASVQQYKDLRTKGFSDKVFDGKKCKCVHSLSPTIEVKQSLTLYTAEMASECVYYIATQTNLFEEVRKEPIEEIFMNDNIVFTAALLLQISLVLHSRCYCSNLYLFIMNKMEVRSMGISLYPFCSFFDHSCAPNTAYIFSGENEMVVYATHPIKKGSRVTTSYMGHSYLQQPKDIRQNVLEQVYRFKCSCIACKKNWKMDDLKICATLLSDKPNLLKKISSAFKKISNTLAVPKPNTMPYDYLNELLYILRLFAQKSLIHTKEYVSLLEYLHLMYVTLFVTFMDD